MFKVLSARVLVFAVACLWVLGWLAIGMVLYEPLSNYLEAETNSWIQALLQIWYGASLIIVGAIVAVRGFRFVGKWEMPGKSSDSEEKD